MLTITVGATEYFNEETNKIEYHGGTVVAFEHSLVSLSKWEEKYEKPFLGSDEKTIDEIVGYIEAMIVTPDCPPDILEQLDEEAVKKLMDYMKAKMTATWFTDTKRKSSTETITAELIYYWMASTSIPNEYEHWHLNKLFTLLRIFAAKSEKPAKEDPAVAAANRRALNEKRLAEFENAE